MTLYDVHFGLEMVRFALFYVVLRVAPERYSVT